MKRYTKPIHLQELKPHRRADSSLALINVVFLLLLFLIVSGTLRPPLPEGFDWAETVRDTGSGNLQGSLVLDRDGAVWFEGDRLDTAALLSFLDEAAKANPRLVVQVDRRSRMEAVSALAAQLKASGIRQVSLMTIEAGRP
ncbi:ExbD/TolR family protein [Roseibium sp. M-1]